VRDLGIRLMAIEALLSDGELDAVPSAIALEA
jgi:hypothetical protein